MKEAKISAAVFFAYVAILVALYFPTLSGGPLVDDFGLLSTAKSGGWFANFPATSEGVAGMFWRPMVSVFLKAEWLLFHLNFSGYRIASVLLCSLTALSIYAVLFKVTGQRRMAVIAAALFSLWPTHAETIVWIAGQTDGLATCLAWLGIWGFVDYWQRPKLATFRILLWFVPLCLSLLAKESVIVVPLLILGAGLVLSLSEKVGKSHAFAGVSLLAFSMLVLTFGYLRVRGVMLHTSDLGGGYESGSRAGLIERTLSGFSSPHLNYNLLNAYAPLSNRASSLVRWTSDAALTLMMLFGIGALVRRLRDDSIPIRAWVSALAVLVFLLASCLALFGTYPIGFVIAIVEEPSGAIVATILLALIGYVAFRLRKEISNVWTTLSRGVHESSHLPYVATAIVACLAYGWVRNGVPNGTLLFYSLAYWAMLFVCAPRRTSERRQEARLALFLALASVIALIPVLTIKEVDGNFAIARVSYLATTFSVSAIVVGIWALARTNIVRKSLCGGVAVVLLFISLPVIRSWTESVTISAAFVDSVVQVPARRIYVLASPGVTPSATGVVLGGKFLSDAGTLLRDDGAQVIPGYFVDGFSFSDNLRVEKSGDSTWRIAFVNGGSRYRSGRLSFLPCDAMKESAHFTSEGIAGNNLARAVTVKGLEPGDAVMVASTPMYFEVQAR